MACLLTDDGCCVSLVQFPGSELPTEEAMTALGGPVTDQEWMEASESVWPGPEEEEEDA